MLPIVRSHEMLYGPVRRPCSHAAPVQLCPAGKEHRAPASRQLVALRPGSARSDAPGRAAGPSGTGPSPSAGPRGRGQGSGGHQRPAAARRPGRPRRACPERGPPAPRPGRAAERRGAPATAPLLKAKAGAPPWAGPLPGVLCQKGSPRTSGKRPQEPKACFGRVCAAIGASSQLTPVSFCSNA